MRIAYCIIVVICVSQILEWNEDLSREMHSGLKCTKSEHLIRLVAVHSHFRVETEFAPNT